MKFKCLTCQKTIERSYHVDSENSDLYGGPWYIDETGLKHLALVCLHCGTIHDVSGSFLRGILTFFRSQVKVHNDINPFELGLMVMQHTDKPETESRYVAIEKLRIPERVIDVLVERELLGHAFAK